MRGDVYMQSQWLALKVVELYYTQNCSQEEISLRLKISKSTVSRLLKRAKEYGFIKFSIPDRYQNSLNLGHLLQASYGLSEVMVVPSCFAVENSALNFQTLKTVVAIEGARYLQRIITPNDILGVAWGRTMNLLIDHLNPCQRMDIPFVTLHGNIQQCDASLDVEYLVRRISMAFGGQYLSLDHRGLQSNAKAVQNTLKIPSVKRIFDIMRKVTISICSVGAFYPDLTTPLGQTNYLSEAELEELKEKHVSCDFMLRFLDLEGNEINSSLAKRTLSIDLNVFRMIPCKILVASGPQKAYSVRSVLLSKLADVLIIDELLASELIKIGNPSHIADSVTLSGDGSFLER